MQKTIAELEAESITADNAHRAAMILLGKIDALINAATMLENAVDDPTLTGDVQQAAWVSSPERTRKALEPLRAAHLREIDRLEDAKIAAERALNDAPEEAA